MFINIQLSIIFYSKLYIFIYYKVFNNFSLIIVPTSNLFNELILLSIYIASYYTSYEISDIDN